MTKVRKSNKEAKRKPLMTMKEKRAAKKSKKAEKEFLGNAKAVRSPALASGSGHP